MRDKVEGCRRKRRAVAVKVLGVHFVIRRLPLPGRILDVQCMTGISTGEWRMGAGGKFDYRRKISELLYPIQVRGTWGSGGSAGW